MFKNKFQIKNKTVTDRQNRQRDQQKNWSLRFFELVKGHFSFTNQTFTGRRPLFQPYLSSCQQIPAISIAKFNKAEYVSY